MAYANLPFSFSPNTPAYSAQVNSNFSTITAQLNGNVDAANLASGAVTPSRIATLPRVQAAVALPYNHLASQGGQVTLGTAAFDTDNMYDDVNDYFTIVTAGVYLVAGYVEMLASSPAALYVRRLPGGVGAVNIGGISVLGSGSTSQMGAVGSAYFAVGDRIDMAWYNYAAAQNGLGGTAGYLAATWLSP